MSKLQLSNAASIEHRESQWYVFLNSKSFRINETIATVLNKFKEPTTINEVLNDLIPQETLQSTEVVNSVQLFLSEMKKIGVLKRENAKDYVEIPSPLFEINSRYNQYTFKSLILINNHIQIFKVYNHTRKRTAVIKIFAHSTEECKTEKRLIKNYEMFLQEIDITSSIPSHRNINKYIQSNILNDYLYFEIDYINGETLSKNIKINSILKKNKNTIALQLLLAVAHLHKHNIIHSDIHARNFMINDKGKVKMIDFGFSHNLKNETLKKQYMVKGGVTHYMTPERVQLHSYKFSDQYSTKSSEVYQMGLILYGLYKGKNPFKTAKDEITWREMAQDILTREFNEEISGIESIDVIIRKALKIKPEERFLSCVEMYKEFNKNIK
ncbi:protein kinase [Flavobacterium sp.]|uniref:protein kinase domain-containing protein n=1 Tax=Flavobacterium sp. TaxID=239 RepID=UPI00374FE695